MSPLKFFKIRRLCRARHTLLQGAVERGADRGAVKRAALDAGLTELGRFSVEYRALFGEPPSVTLHAARQPAPTGALESQAFPART
jgi:AraC-like DNA-binding protein